MTRLLASVTNVEEALIALESGADIIDLKNPAEGALGALPLSVIHDVVKAVDRRKPISATVGDLPMCPDQIVARVTQTAATGVDFVKIGMFGTQGHLECVKAMQPISSQGVSIVAVMFADEAPDMRLLPALEANGFKGVMLDTARKDGKRLLDWMTQAALADFVRSGERLGLMTGLAGALRHDDVPLLTPLNADYLGFRSALCEQHDRTSCLKARLLKEISGMLHNCNIMDRTSA